jgi:hypothetical protein
MVRTQIQLTDEQFRRLKAVAAKRGLSLAELVRQGVERVLAGSGEDLPAIRKRRALEAVGRFDSGSGSLSADHDRLFAASVEGGE